MGSVTIEGIIQNRLEAITSPVGCLWRCVKVRTSVGNRDVVCPIMPGLVLKSENQVSSITGGTSVPVLKHDGLLSVSCPPAIWINLGSG